MTTTNLDLDVSRRRFLAQLSWLTSAAALGGLSTRPALGAPKFAPPVVVFSKVYHQAKLSLEDSAALTAEAGLDGVDCPVRPNDQILPERVKDDLPRYAEILRARKLSMPLLTTAILSTDSPHASDILTTAKQLGIRYYRVGFIKREKGAPTGPLIEKTRAQFKDLAALNKQLGLCALVQNHSQGNGPGYIGGDLSDMLKVVEGFDPGQIAVAFDLGHAIIVHGDDWSTQFERLKPHIKVAYIKDASRTKGFVSFGEGEFARTDFFKRLKAMDYSAPLSLHIEYAWEKSGVEKRAALAQALKASTAMLQQWLAAA